MSLKTSSEMPVHGADGVHVRFVPETGRLIIYSGEAKLYKDIGAAIDAAAASIKNALSHEKMRHELDLVQRNIDFAGLPQSARDALLRYLDPFDEASNARHEVVTCLIGFDFDGYGKVETAGEKAEETLCELAVDHLRTVGPAMAAALKAAGLASQEVELFLLPVPSVQDLRDKFQDTIGWKAS